MKIIPYENNHLNACLELFNSNEPTYFDESERAPFEKYLKGDKYSYWVLMDEGNLLACGGFEIEKPGDARIVWLMVERSKQGKGYGATLMQHFQIQKTNGPTIVRPRARQQFPTTIGNPNVFLQPF